MVTGATGDVGSQLALFLAKHRQSVVALVRNNEDSALKAAHLYKKSTVNIVQSELSHITQLQMHIVDCTHIIHCAAHLKSKVDEAHSARTWLVNAFYTGLLARLTTPDKTFIYFSTHSIYEIPQSTSISHWLDDIHAFLRNLVLTQPLTVEHVDETLILSEIEKWLISNAAPHVDLYAASKYVGELLANSLATTCIVVRLTNIFGPGYSLKRAIPKIIYNRLKGDEITMHNTVRNYLYQDDIGAIILHLAHTILSGSTTINFNSEKYVSTKELVKKINFYTPTGYGIVHFPEEEAPTHTPLIRRELATPLVEVYPKPLTSFDEALRSTIYHVQDRIVRKMDNNHTVSFFIHKHETLIKTMFGSSSAQVLLLIDEKKVPFIRKIALRRGVEGNGYPKLRSEHDFLVKLRKEVPNLSILYPQVLHSRNYGDAFSLDYEYIEGGMSAYTALISHQLSPQQFIVRFQNLFDVAIKEGYLRKTDILSKVESQRERSNFYLHRAEYRLKGLSQNRFAIDFMTQHGFSFGKLLSQKEIKINGKVYCNTHTLIDRINSNKKLRDVLRVRKNNFCVHGDLTFLNILFDKKTNSFKFIDPRGHFGLWDPLYDLGKLVFTLQGFGNIVESTYSLAQTEEGGFTIEMDDLKGRASVVNEALAGLMLYFEKGILVQKLIGTDPYWREKIYLSAATHFIADIPYRLFIDKSPKNAFVCYLLGTIYLNEAYEHIINAPTKK